MTDSHPADVLKPGKQLLWYRISRVLGRGAFGITYLAEDINLHRPVAIKEFFPSQYCSRVSGSETIQPISEESAEHFKWAMQRFTSEARTLAQLEHPNIVRVINVFADKGTAYMVMNYESGVSFSSLLKKHGSISESDLTKITLPLLDGLEKVHASGFIHRDIKPSNIYIRDSGVPVLLDFGSTRQCIKEQTQSLTSMVSPGYAPIEQYTSNGKRQGAWTDIYGLGATLYRAATGRTPPTAVDRCEALAQGRQDTVGQGLEELRDSYSENFLNAIKHALAFRIDDRPQSIAEWRPEFDFDTALMDAPLELFIDTNPSNQGTRGHAEDRSPRTLPLSGNKAGDRHGDDEGKEKTHPPHRAFAPPEESVMEESASDRDSGAAGEFSYALRNAEAKHDHSGRLDKSPSISGFDTKADSSSQDQPLSATELPDLYHEFTQQVEKLLLTPQAEEAASQKSVNARASKAEERAYAQERTELPRMAPREPETTPVAEDIAAPPDWNKRQRRHGFIYYTFVCGLSVAAALILIIFMENSGIYSISTDFTGKSVQTENKAGSTSGGKKTSIAQAENDRANDPARQDLTGAGAESRKGTDLDQFITKPDRLNETTNNTDKSASTRVSQEQKDINNESVNTDKLLAAASADIQARRLTTPAGNNAFDKYQQVLEVDPGNRKAQEGLQKILDIYLIIARNSLSKGKLDHAETMLARAEKINPDSSQLAQARHEIESQREEQPSAPLTRTINNRTVSPPL